MSINRKTSFIIRLLIHYGIITKLSANYTNMGFHLPVLQTQVSVTQHILSEHSMYVNHKTYYLCYWKPLAVQISLPTKISQHSMWQSHIFLPLFTAGEYMYKSYIQDGISSAGPCVSTTEFIKPFMLIFLGHILLHYIPTCTVA